MSFITRHSRLLAVALSCVAIGAAISAIASAGAAPKAKPAAAAKAGKAGKAGKRGPLARWAARAVQGSVVVHTKDGYRTVTFERGRVTAVDGQRLTIAEGTPKATYRTVTVTVPAGAVVRDNRKKASLSAVKPGQRVTVLTAPKRTLVIARTPKTP